MTVDFSEYTQDGDKKIYIDYPYMNKLTIGSEISFEASQVLLKVKKLVEDYAECEVIEAKSNAIIQYDRVILEHNEEPQSVLSEQDKKHIMRGMEY